jgi:hypothetical protein
MKLKKNHLLSYLKCERIIHFFPCSRCKSRKIDEKISSLSPEIDDTFLNEEKYKNLQIVDLFQSIY